MCTSLYKVVLSELCFVLCQHSTYSYDHSYLASSKLKLSGSLQINQFKVSPLMNGTLFGLQLIRIPPKIICGSTGTMTVQCYIFEQSTEILSIWRLLTPQPTETPCLKVVPIGIANELNLVMDQIVLRPILY